MTLTGIRRALPRGNTLPHETWLRRHRALLWLLWAHVAAIVVYAAAQGYGVVHGLQEGGIIAAIAFAASIGAVRPRPASALVSLGLVTSSSLVVHLSDGVIEAHFHFFVVIVLLTLYEDWLPFLLAAAYVTLHHGVVGTLDPTSVYNHAAAISDPWTWAGIHGLFVTAAGIAGVAAWRLNEDHRVHTEIALRRTKESEERYAVLVETAGEGIVSADSRGRIISFNGAAEEIFGRSASEAIGRPLRILMPGRFRAAHESGLRRYLSTGEPRVVGQNLELAGLRRDGTEFPLEMSLTTWRSSGQAFFTGVLRDITERKRTESYRRARHGVARGAAANLSLGGAGWEILRGLGRELGWDLGELWLVDDASDRLRCIATWHPGSPRLEQFAAVTRKGTFARGEGLPGKVWEEGRPVWVEDVQKDLEFVRHDAAADAGLRGAVALPVRAEDQLVGVIAFMVSEPRKPDPELVGVMNAIATDVGGFLRQRQAEAELRRSQAELAVAQRVAQLGSWEWDIGADLVTWSDELCRIFGVEPSAHPRTYSDFLALVHPEDRDTADGIVKQALVDHNPYRFDHRVVRPGGEIRIVESHGRVITDETERAARMCGTTQDITERREAERQAEQAKNEFFSLVSHELRTPLTAITGYVDLLQELERERLSESGRGYLDVVQRNASRELRLVDDLLTLTRLEGGTFAMNVGSVDLTEIVRQSAEAARPTAEGKLVTLSVELEQVDRLEGDPQRLAQVCDNLISNALKFTPPGGRVSVRLSSVDDSAVIEVTDTGMGIPAAEQARLFERLYRSRKAQSKQIPGTGLGLTIVKAIVDAHGGSIGFQSEDEAGTRFRVTLPIQRAAADEGGVPVQAVGAETVKT